VCSEDLELQELMDRNPTEWLQALGSYHYNLFEEMLSSGMTPETVAEQWLTPSVASNTAPFGSSDSGRSLYFEKLLNEIHDFLCSKTRYAAQRSEYRKQLGLGKNTALVSISTYISSELGTAPPLVAPAIAVTFFAIGQIGLNAWCETQKERRNKKN
jgi:hypothetical protein